MAWPPKNQRGITLVQVRTIDKLNEKKHEYNQGVADRLKVEIEEAEEKVHAMQSQASVIKSNAQFKKVANLYEMDDACSYKLWVKEKTEKEMHELCAHLRKLEEFL
jgi:SMC interacting uncharacterized protein involved in chromosome segregation